MQDGLAELVRGVDVSAVLEQRVDKVKVDLGLLVGSFRHLGEMLDQGPVAVDDHPDVQHAAAVSPHDGLVDEAVMDVIQTNAAHLGLVLVFIAQETSCG